MATQVACHHGTVSVISASVHDKPREKSVVSRVRYSYIIPKHGGSVCVSCALEKDQGSQLNGKRSCVYRLSVREKSAESSRYETRSH